MTTAPCVAEGVDAEDEMKAAVELIGCHVQACGDVGGQGVVVRHEETYFGSRGVESLHVMLGSRDHEIREVCSVRLTHRHAALSQAIDGAEKIHRSAAAKFKQRRTLLIGTLTERFHGVVDQ